MVNTKNSTYILIMIYYCPFFTHTFIFWCAILDCRNEGKDGTVPALKQLFFYFCWLCRHVLASRLSQKFIWKVAPFSMGFH